MLFPRGPLSALLLKGGRGSGGTIEVTILIVIINFFRISTQVVVAVGVIIVVVFGIVIIVDGNIVATAKASLGIVIFSVAFGCSIRLTSSRGWELFYNPLERRDEDGYL